MYLNKDCVSEGQFYQVLLYELDAIRKVNVVIFFLLSYIYILFITKTCSDKKYLCRHVHP
jgi:hypothetical protein